MGGTWIAGNGVGMGFGVGCGFGVGWGFGGIPIGILGMGAGGGCGVGFGLAWGRGVGWGSRVVNTKAEFEETKRGGSPLSKTLAGAAEKLGIALKGGRM